MRRLVAEIIDASIRRAEERGLLPGWSERPSALSTVDVPRNPEHGDWASNAALTYAKAVQRKPIEVARALLDNLSDEQGALAGVAIAVPGFLNFRIAPEVWLRGLRAIEEQGAHFGESQAGRGQKVNVEFVSVNP